MLYVFIYVARDLQNFKKYHELTFYDYLYGCLQPDLCPLPSGKTNKGHSMSPDPLFIVIR